MPFDTTKAQPEYVVDDYRKLMRPKLGVLVRARTASGDWGPADLNHLTTESLLRWLRSRGGDNPLAEDLVGDLLGHGPLHYRRERKTGSIMDLQPRKGKA